MYFVNQIQLEAKKELKRLEAICEKNDVDINSHFSYENYNNIWIEADKETRDWFSIDAPIHLWEDGYSQGHASDEELKEIAKEIPNLISYDDEDEIWNFEGLDKEWCERFEQKFKEEIGNTEIAIDNEIEVA